MKSVPNIRAWYVSTQRIVELIDHASFSPAVLQSLYDENMSMAKAILANELGTSVLDYVTRHQIQPFEKLAVSGQLAPGTKFWYHGHFYGKGFGANNRNSLVSLSEDVSDFVPNTKLVVEFGRRGITTDTALSRLGGSTQLYALCEVSKIEQRRIEAIPFIIGDLIYECEGGMKIQKQRRELQLTLDKVDEFSAVNLYWNPSAKVFESLKGVSEAAVKGALCKLLGEHFVPKDWGGEECDLYTTQFQVEAVRKTAAFLLKGPSCFHEMTPADCGKNADQIYRLFGVRADVYVLQHCHKIGPAVRGTVDAFAQPQPHPCRYLIIDGYDTCRILRSQGIV